MEIFVNVVNQKLRIASNVRSLVEDTQNFVKFCFNLSEEWDGLQPFAQFIQNGEAFNRVLDAEGCCYLPSQIEAGKCYVLLHGEAVKNSGTANEISFKATTEAICLDVNESMLIADASSTEIDPTIYQQFVEKVNEILDLNNSDYSELIQNQIADILAGYLSDGKFAALSIGDGTITREKLSAQVEETLEKADNAWQKSKTDTVPFTSGSWESVYDPNGYGKRQKPIDPYSFAQGQDESTIARMRGITQANVQSGNQVYVVTDSGNVDHSYTGIDGALAGVYALARSYVAGALSDYDPFTIVVDPEGWPLESGADRTFYLIPKGKGKYEKWWYITNEEGKKTWDNFGSSSTVIVSALPAPQEADEDADYILASGGEYQYYKCIDGTWALIAGTNAVTTPVNHNLYAMGSGAPAANNVDAADADVGEAYLDTATLTYYIAEINMASTGEQTHVWTVGGTLIASPSITKDYFVRFANTGYFHFRYDGSAFVQVGTDAYSRSEADAMAAGLGTRITNLANDTDNQINTIEAKVDALGNLVSDVTETDTGINVHYKDGTSKKVQTKSDTVTVEDVDKMESNAGIVLTYTDGSKKELEISGGGGGASSGSASITRETAASIQSVYGETCPIAYTFSALDSAGDQVGSGSATWYVNNIKKATSTAEQNVTNTFDIGPYLNVGTNTVRLSISVDTGTGTPTTTTKTWTVNAVNLYLTWDYDDTTLNTSDTVALRWTPYGDLAKTTHIIIDGVEREDLKTSTTRSGVQQYVTMDKLAHGSHLVKLYLTAEVSGTAITSPAVVHDMMFVDSENAAPVISCSLDQASMVQYNTLRIPIAVYNPSSLTATVVLKEDGETVTTWENIDRSVHYWNYTPDTYGTRTLTISCGETAKTLTLQVEKLDINNEEVPGYAFRLKASDIAGNSALREWRSNGIKAYFSDNFDWNNGGIKTETDKEGNIRQYICVKAGTTMTIGYELFGNDAKINGKNVKVIFKTNNCRDYDAEWLTCVADGIGLSLGANGGTASSEQNTVNVQYAEGSYTEFEYDIYPDNLVSAAGNPMRYILTWLDGVMASANLYAANDNFSQISEQRQIVIGSEDCDVYIYMVKVYETYMTRENHIVNFIADAPNAVEMVTRYNRNNILAENGEIDYQKLARQNQNCRVHLWDIPRMTQNKIGKDPVAGCSYQQIYMAGTEGDQLTAENVIIGVQGTSSVNYIASAANIDGNFTEGFTDGNGNRLDGYAMTEGSEPVAFFNTKVNVASCENINNMCLAQWYDAHQPYITGARARGGRDCMEHHIGVQFIRDRHEDNEPASAALFTDTDPDGSNYHMYAVCNMGNSKENGTVFHDADNPLECCFETKDNNSAVCMMISPLDEELLDTEDHFEFRYPGKTWRKDPANAEMMARMKTAFISFVNWACSRNPAAATGSALATPVTYGPYTFKGTSSWDKNEQNEVLAGLTISDYAGTYTHDTYEYRMARLLDECEDHMVMDSIVYHYVFVEHHAMVDNVCKNAFWGTDDLVHWHLCKNYDNDTADGNDNVGRLTVPFGSEGMDTVNGKAVFNGNQNVYWQLVYGLYPARRLMWQNREAVGTWNVDAYLEYATGQQEILPERVWNQDYWYKYLRPWEQSGTDTYITMFAGGQKKHQREGFTRNNLVYMASQYTGTYCTSDSITLRAYTPTVSDDLTEEEKAVIRKTLEVVPPATQFQIMLYNKGYVVVEVASAMKRIKAEKGVYYTVTFEGSANLQETVINIHSAGNVRAIGDLSAIYPGFSNFSKGSRLRYVKIGSPIEGYCNNNLTSVSFASNPMLEELYIQNCPKAEATLDLSSCQSLRSLDVRGSGFTGIIFAVGGLVEKAKLCSPASVSMRNLYYLEDENLSLESYAKLTTLRFEDNPKIDSLAIVRAASALNRVRVMGIDWTLPDTELLNRMLTLAGLDENDHNTEVSVLAGSAYVSGSIRNQELFRYSKAWPNLDVDYNANNLVTQFLVTYVNADDEATVLYQEYVDQGSTPPDPVALGLIGTPTLADTQQYTYTYNGWDDLSSQVFAPRTITAAYTTTVRKYSVTWYSRPGMQVAKLDNLEYGSEAVYPGTTPTWTDGEGQYQFHVFSGWDKSTGFVRSNMEVYAAWIDANGLPAAGTRMEDMNVAQIYGIGYAGQQDVFWREDDYTDIFADITLGWNPGFINVEETEIGKDAILTDIPRDKYVSGGYYFDGTKGFTTDIRMFDEDSEAFTMAIDFQFSDLTSGATLVSNHSGATAEGFRLYHNGTKVMLQWGDQSVAVGYQRYRDIVVLRHPKGSRYLYVYSAGDDTSGRFKTSVTKTNLLRTSTPQTSEPLSFGAVAYASGFRNHAKGHIHWCKIWHDDLGEDAAYKLAAWPRETIRMEYWGAGWYYYWNSQETSKASWICNSIIGGVKGRGFWHNSTNDNSVGWDGSLLRALLNGRIYDALPIEWKSIIKDVEIVATKGRQSTEVTASQDKLYLASHREVGGSGDGYINEVGTSTNPIPWLITNLQRIKFKGKIREYNLPLLNDTGKQMGYYSCATEPAALYQTDIMPGAIWINTNNSNIGYIFLTQEELDHYGITPDIAADSEYAQGGWVSANSWWERSPYIGHTASFLNVYAYGNPGNYSNAAYGFGVVPGFSI